MRGHDRAEYGDGIEYPGTALEIHDTALALNGGVTHWTGIAMTGAGYAEQGGGTVPHR